MSSSLSDISLSIIFCLSDTSKRQTGNISLMANKREGHTEFELTSHGMLQAKLLWSMQRSYLGTKCTHNYSGFEKISVFN